MKNVFATFVILGLSYCYQLVIAQCPECDQALEHGTQVYYKNEMKSDFKQILTEVFKHDYQFFEHGDYKQDKNFQSGGSYGVISGFLNGDESSEDKMTRFNQIKSDFLLNNDISSSDYKLLSESYPSEIVYKSWFDCIKTCSSFDGPILEATISGNDLTVTFYWQHNNNNDRQTIRDIKFGGNLIPVPGGSLGKLKIVKGRNSYTKSFRISDVHISDYVIVNMSNYPVAKIIIPSVIAKNIPVFDIVQVQYDFITFEDEKVGTKSLYIVNPGCSNCGCGGRPCYGGNGATVVPAFLAADPNNYFRNAKFTSTTLNPFTKIFDAEYWLGMPPTGPKAPADSASIVTIRTDGWGPGFDGTMIVDVYAKTKVKNQALKEVQIINNKIFFDLPISASEDDSYLIFKGQRYKISSLSTESFVKNETKTQNSVETDYVVELND